MIVGQPAQLTVAQSTAQQAFPDSPKPQIPDAPRPQGLPVQGTKPGMGTTPTSNGDTSDDQNAPAASLPPAVPKADDGPPPTLPAAGKGSAAFADADKPVSTDAPTIHVQTNFVEVPFIVKDKKGRLVPGLTWRDVRVYENGLRQQMALFTVDPFPMSVALVIDQSLTYDNMAKVNGALESIQAAFTPYDEVAVFTYNNGPRKWTDFTGGQSARLSFVLTQSKTGGRDPIWADTGGPLSQNININNGAQSYIDPNTNSSHGRSLGNQQTVPREVHTLNDAILEAAIATTKAGPGRRRVVYVISDGKEYGSKAKYKDVVKYLQTNKIAVYGTLVGDSSLPVVGYLDKMHLPLMMRDNILPSYAADTGGQFNAQFRQKGIEESFAKIAEEVRTQYTVGYYTHQPFIDGKFRSLEVKVLRPDLQVVAKKGYYPTASDARPSTAKTVQ
ncbi:MAG TPA: VWA domain-containing protein [Edaphobacter sp.]|nr:VWA domain-containing protein [Edaphobacter sp.]